MSTRVHEIYIRASAEAIWEAVTTPEWTSRYKIRPKSATNRMVATCCNAAVVLTFDDSKHWVGVYRTRVSGDLPPLQMRMRTRYRQGGPLDPAVRRFLEISRPTAGKARGGEDRHAVEQLIDRHTP